ncbi:MAG TPA: TIM barrel protein [Pirellulaceae bacterium]|nr:TIM barrel protein [Pirellulaceae bacterium]HMO91659.1 TIM barrel protein [Pirellulaceae bacterium]HMP68356.1 TIM barrel protein [Pirellulaceae bacterium]
MEFTSLEIAISEENELNPQLVIDNLNRAVLICNDTRRMNVCSYLFDSKAQGAKFFEQFEACCKLAKSTKVVTIVVPSAELGTPFNEEVERFKELVRIATLQGVRVCMRSEHNCLSGDPDTVRVICDHIDGLGLAYDPSHYIYQSNGKSDHERLLKYAFHVYLRDTSATKLQVQVGQGVVDYGRLINLLAKHHYNRALCIQISPEPGIDQMAEIRKLRLLLESLLV